MAQAASCSLLRTFVWRVARTLTILGIAYGALGDAARKRDLLQRALAIFEHVCKVLSAFVAIGNSLFLFYLLVGEWTLFGSVPLWIQPTGSAGVMQPVAGATITGCTVTCKHSRCAGWSTLCWVFFRTPQLKLFKGCWWW